MNNQSETHFTLFIFNRISNYNNPKKIKKISGQSSTNQENPVYKFDLTHRFQVKSITTDLIIDFLLTLINPSQK
ncbi:hypothetical protein CICLE_v10023177mg [Citrus x clementina]|uniref:Uncharacterized protein n=2 Tax=Citrus TaxID=2706 RepID=A0A067EXW2_CITSI|nr:hypothetical protein CICLE_v10023177mg [Citrus x clementina]KDO56062.1 hypothetical protein CISIN_1g040773mg [Citrus sinensis]